MGKIIKYAIFAVVIYLIYVNAPTWIENISDLGSGLGRKGSSVGAGRCVTAAETASESFSRELRDYSKPPIDMESWDLFMERLKGQLYDADTECGCPRDSCQKATEALSELNALIADFDNSLRGSGMPLNPARRQETIDRLLRRARELDRQGN
ncbi:MAG: hypothetical protein GY719_39195 [bacterium]|nr:hypothetical protein [bacterium]